MKVLLTVHQFLPEFSTGTELIAYYLAVELRRLGHEVAVLTGAPLGTEDGGVRADNYVYDGLTVHRVRHGGEWRCVPRQADLHNRFRLDYDDPALREWFAGFLRNERPDVVHCLHLARLSAGVIDACADLGIPCVFTATDYWAVCPLILMRLADGSICSGPRGELAGNCVRHVMAEWRRGALPAGLFEAPSSGERAALTLADRWPAAEWLASEYMTEVRDRAAYLRSRFRQLARILVPSRTMQQTLIDHGFEAAKIEHVPYGTPVDVIGAGTGKAPASDAMRLRVGYIGQISEHKGCHVLAEALAGLPAEVPVEAVFHGDLGASPGYVEQLRQRLASVSDRVTLAGVFPHDRLGAILGGLDVLVCPSLWKENTPLVIYEAQAAGVPVVASDLPGAAEAVKPGVNGLLFPPGDAGALGAILRQLAMDRPRLRQLAAQAEVPLSTAMHAQRVEAVYRAVLESHLASPLPAEVGRLQACIEAPLDAPLEAGHGVGIIVEGWAYHPDRRVTALHVEMGEGAGVRQLTPVEWGLPRRDVLQRAARKGNGVDPGFALCSGFWCVLPIEAAAVERSIPVRLVATLADGTVARSSQRVLRVGASPAPDAPALDVPPMSTPSLPSRARVCLCMATYNPTEERFRRQVDSIRAQDYADWICLVQDDGSDEAGREVLQRVLEGDPRFVLERNERNLGFYGNFQRALERVPADCRLVGLSDQDDRWFPQKLSRLVAAFDAADVTLAYSDMHIVDDGGRLLSKTFWTVRDNNFTDMESLIYGNTVTGGAMLFRAELLGRILPFPPRQGLMYHDWWIALVALASGRMRFVEEPLYAYYQHGENVVGWASGKEGFVSLSGLVRSGEYRGKVTQLAMQMYERGCKTLAVAAETLRLRVPDSPHAAALRRMARLGTHPLRTLVEQWVRTVLLGRATVNRERNLLVAHLLRRWLSHRAAVQSRDGQTPPSEESHTPDPKKH